MPQVDVTIKGHDQLSPTMRECRGSVTDFNQALEVAGKVTRTVGQIYEATVGEYLEYADVVGDLSSITGQSSESTSRFITVLGDFGIEMGQVTAMGRAMRDEGLTPTLETLAQLSDRYLALAPGMERTNFLYETLGRNGAQFTDVLDQGSAAIMERAGLVREGNILTQQEIEEADALRVKEEELNDAWHNITRTIAGEVLPTVTDLVQGLLDLGDAHIYAYGPHGQILYEINDGLGSLDARTRDAAGGMDEGARAARGLGDAINALPTTHTTTVTLDASGAIQVLDDYMARLTAAGIWTFSGVGGFNVGAGGQVVVGGTQPGTSPEVWTAGNANYLSRKRYWESLHPGQTYSGAAAGGPLGLITEVGEEGTEGIINGMVIPHDLWERLKRMGLQVDQHAVLGGDPQNYYPLAPKAPAPKGTIKKGAVSGGGYITPVTVADIAAEVQQASAQESAALVASIPAAAASAASEQGRQQVAETRRSNDETNAILRRVERAIDKLNETFPTVVRDAVERIQ